MQLRLHRFPVEQIALLRLIEFSSSWSPQSANQASRTSSLAMCVCYVTTKKLLFSYITKKGAPYIWPETMPYRPSRFLLGLFV